MEQFVDVVERDKHVFNVEVKDPGAPVDFYINGNKISKSDERCEYVNMGEGKHQLIIHHIKICTLTFVILITLTIIIHHIFPFILVLLITININIVTITIGILITITNYNMITKNKIRFVSIA